MSKTTEQVRLAVGQLVEQMGFALVDVELKKEGTEQILYLYIDQESGVSVDDCARVSREIDPIIDALDPVAGPYVLCVSSPGADRPLKTDADFHRTLGKEVEVSLYQGRDGQKHWVGCLNSYDDSIQTLTIAVENERPVMSFHRKEIARIRPHIKF